jgi:hypothetical protein
MIFSWRAAVLAKDERRAPDPTCQAFWHRICDTLSRLLFPWKSIEMIRLVRCGLVLAIVLLGPRTALACACCTDEGQRNVATVELDSGKRQEIESLRFGGKATLFTGAGDVEGVEGITTPSGSYDLAAKWLDNRLVFSFRDKVGRTGALALARPNVLSVFEVDPRNVPDKGGQGRPAAACSRPAPAHARS